jgi:DNA-binding NarL/FixJ family response regulator
MNNSRPSLRSAILALVIAMQTLSAAFFLFDVLRDMTERSTPAITLYLATELFASASLVMAIAIETRVLMQILRREAHMVRSLTAAARGLHEIMETHFADWGLTPSEQDIATFLVKGADIAEIARLRGSAPGTIKAHLNNIYRKADVSGRPALLALLIEDLMAVPPISQPSATSRETAK